MCVKLECFSTLIAFPIVPSICCRLPNDLIVCCHVHNQEYLRDISYICTLDITYYIAMCIRYMHYVLLTYVYNQLKFFA